LLNGAQLLKLPYELEDLTLSPLSNNQPSYEVDTLTYTNDPVSGQYQIFRPNNSSTTNPLNWNATA